MPEARCDINTRCNCPRQTARAQSCSRAPCATEWQTCPWYAPYWRPGAIASCNTLSCMLSAHVACRMLQRACCPLKCAPVDLRGSMVEHARHLVFVLQCAAAVGCMVACCNVVRCTVPVVCCTLYIACWMLQALCCTLFHRGLSALAPPHGHASGTPRRDIPRPGIP